MISASRVHDPLACGQWSLLMSTPTEECTCFLDFVTFKNICNCSHLICNENKCSKFYVIMQ